MKTVRNTPPFRKLVGTTQFGGDPSKGSGHPHSSGSFRDAVQSQTFEFSDGLTAQGILTGAQAASTGVIAVQNTGGGTCDLDTGFVYLTIGDLRINVGLEPVISAVVGYPTPTVANLGGVLATLINNLPDFAAVHAGGGVVNVTGPTGPGGGYIPFAVEHMGTVTNFVLAPATGFLTIGGPAIGPATLT